MSEPLLAIKNLSVTFVSHSGSIRAVERVSLEVQRGETLGIVGESGSGKSVMMLAVMGLLPRTKRVVTSGEVLFQGGDVLRASKRELRRLRGRHLALIPQDPMTCLDPVLRVGKQLHEAIRAHETVPRAEVQRRGIELLTSVGLPEPERHCTQFPHELSGGMRQRTMIAMGIAHSPSLLIADEPTTALDVTIQAQVMDLLGKAQSETNTGLVLITHDLGLVAEMADRVVVMYAGRVVETGDVQTIFRAPRHPYTRGLLDSLPQLSNDERWLHPIPGNPPDPAYKPMGCSFEPRCFLAGGRARCGTELPVLAPAGVRGHKSACHFAEEMVDILPGTRSADEEQTP